MNSDPQHPSVRDRILAKIEHDNVRMHTRAYFAVRIAGALLLAALILLVTVFIGNFVFFILRLNGHGELLSLGSRGWLLFLRVFPWWLLAIDIVLAALLAWVVRYFQFGYRKPILALFIVLVAAALAGGFLLDEGTPLNDRLLRDADRGALPHPFDAVYKGARRAPPPGSAYRGTVITVQQGSFLLADPDFDDLQTVLLPPPQNHPAPPLSAGEAVLVIGSDENGVIHAIDVHPIDAAGLPPRDDEVNEGP